MFWTGVTVAAVIVKAILGGVGAPKEVLALMSVLTEDALLVKLTVASPELLGTNVMEPELAGLLAVPTLGVIVTPAKALLELNVTGLARSVSVVEVI
jgi:hypothetical protein